jgi:acetyl esterase/lipase
MGQVPAAEGVEYEAATVGGVSGWSVRPDSALSGQAIVYLHGGAYIVGSAEAYRNFVGHIAKASHTAAFIPDYRLAPEHRFPAALDDAWNVYSGLNTLGFERIAIAGDPAGGGLVLSLLAKASREMSSLSAVRPRAAAAIAPCTDLALTGASLEPRAEADPLSTKAFLETAAALYGGKCDAVNPDMSPLYRTLGNLPPVRFHVGEDDVLLDDTVRYAERMAAAGGVIEAHVWEGMIHVFPSNVATLLSAPEAVADIGQFPASHPAFVAHLALKGLYR